MSELATLVEAAHRRAREYTTCSPEQALTYACEDTVESEFGSRELSSAHAESWLTSVCDREDIDVPSLHIARSSQNIVASASYETQAICIRGRRSVRNADEVQNRPHAVRDRLERRVVANAEDRRLRGADAGVRV